jgi:hypothetical protein
MILPQALLAELAFYEETHIEKDGAFYTRFILHYKKWWKLKRTIMIRWRTTRREHGKISWQETDGSVELRDQLRSHFAANTKGWAATV